MTIMVVAFVGLIAVACSKDDDKNYDGVKKELIGKWRRVYKHKITYTKDGSSWKEESNTTKEYKDGESHGFIFKSDGTALSIYVQPNGEYVTETDDVFKFKVDGKGHLLMLEPDDIDEWEDWGAIVIDGSTFELTYEEIDGNYKEWEQLRYQKL